jgi:hypothetical protein
MITYCIGFLLLFSSVCAGQSNQQPGSKREINATEENEMNKRSCVHLSKLGAKERMSLYPFNKAVLIQLVSFDNPDEENIKACLPEVNGKIDYSKLKEIKALNQHQIDTLTDILYNYGYEEPFKTDYLTQCYRPRNAILFLDSSNDVFAYMELCFECKGTRLSSAKFQAGIFCLQKYDLLALFFSEVGISYGIRKEDPIE